MAIPIFQTPLTLVRISPAMFAFRLAMWTRNHAFEFFDAADFFDELREDCFDECRDDVFLDASRFFFDASSFLRFETTLQSSAAAKVHSSSRATVSTHMKCVAYGAIQDALKTLSALVRVCQRDPPRAAMHCRLYDTAKHVVQSRTENIGT